MAMECEQKIKEEPEEAIFEKFTVKLEPYLEMLSGKETHDSENDINEKDYMVYKNDLNSYIEETEGKYNEIKVEIPMEELIKSEYPIDIHHEFMKTEDEILELGRNCEVCGKSFTILENSKEFHPDCSCHEQNELINIGNEDVIKDVKPSSTASNSGGPEECKKRWASIRDQFRRTLQKRKTKSGQAAAKKQKYKYEEVLEFLLPHIMGRETMSNVPSFEEKTDDSELNPRMEESELDPESEAERQNEVSQCSGNSQTIVQPTSPVPLAGCTQPTPRKKHHFARPVNVKRTGSNVEKPAHESPSSQLMAYILAEKETERNKTISATNTPQHPVDIFLASLAPTLKSLDPILLNQAKTAIFATVQEFELKHINRIITNPLRLDMADLPSFETAAGSSSTSHSLLTNESPHETSPHMDCSTSFFDL